LRYVVDTDGDGDSVAERPLAFRQRKALSIAELDLEVRTTSGARRTIPYQVLLDGDRYQYARIADFRRGHLRVGGRDHAVVVHRSSRNTPFFETGDRSTVLVDLDGDGAISEMPGATIGGRPAAVEELVPTMPFVLGARAYVIAAMDSDGTRLVVRPSSARVAAIEGFRAPPFVARSLSGSTYRLAEDAGKVVLITFWSASCKPSEQVRPELNALATRLSASRFRWVAMAREHDTGEVGRYLVEHPMTGTVTPIDSASWAAYNPQTATPLFVVIDGKGVVRMRALGAHALPAVAARVEALLARR
jgi:hypothetical protein